MHTHAQILSLQSDEKTYMYVYVCMYVYREIVTHSIMEPHYKHSKLPSSGFHSFPQEITYPPKL